MGANRRALWLAAAVAPVAWAIDLEATYALAAEACGRGLPRLGLFAVPIAAAVTSALGGLWAWRGWRPGTGASPVAATGSEGWPPDRFLAACGVLGSGFFILVIVAQAIPILVLRTCD
jgi:hypothetical protein